jgi:ribonuclease HI
LIEYDLLYESLQSVKGQVVADFIVDHLVVEDSEVGLIEIHPWSLYFDGSVRSKGQGIRCFIVSPSGTCFGLAARLEFQCTNNQPEYEALLYGLEHLQGIGVRSVNTFRDSRLVVQQVIGESQCLTGMLNEYCDKCLDIVKSLDGFQIKYVPREENKEANALVQQASGYEVTKGMFTIRKRPATRDTISNLDKLVVQCVVNNQKGECERPTLAGEGEFTSVTDEECGRKCMVDGTGDIRANGDRGSREAMKCQHCVKSHQPLVKRV